MMRDASGTVVDGQGKPIPGSFIRKHCTKCKRFRKFEVGTPRYKTGVCGNCWDWGTQEWHDQAEKDLNS